MRELRGATEDEMVLAFLRAEIYSPRFKDRARACLGHDLSVVYNARRDDPTENKQRREALACYRGFGRGQWLFEGFPENAQWKLVSLDRSDLGTLIYARAPEWVVLSRGTRVLSDGAANVGSGAMPEAHEFAAIAAAVGWPESVVHDEETIRKVRAASGGIDAVESELARGRDYAEIILASEAPDAQHYVVEGHTRATAYFRHFIPGADDEVEALVAYSSDLSGWSYF